ncbi:MAG: DnaK suppressor protein [Acidimicrobiales bacterium]|jgi:DnaK suppressor protein|nr:DnaK suppressor protein [Acidimicrobiales bacterium]
MPRTSRSAGPEKAAKKKAATKAAPARAGKASSAGTTKATASTKAAKATPAKAAPAKAGKAAAPAKAGKAAAPAPAKAAKAAKGGPADKFLEAQHKTLLEERETYTRHASERRAEAEQLAADREPGDVQFDEESGQGDSMNVERERDLALSAQAMAAVEDIDKALVKIDAGTYGICERCGQPIPKERLKALPYAALCVACKSGGLTTRR